MTVNERNGVRVLARGDRKPSRSGVIPACLSERSGKFRLEGEDERLDRRDRRPQAKPSAWPA